MKIMRHTRARSRSPLIGKPKNACDLVLRWDSIREDNPNHGNLDKILFGPFKVIKVMDNNTFILQNLDDTEIFGGTVNGHFLKYYFS
jgi:hypothetical protein